MDVFISWSGSQSKQAAEALHRYLPQMINAVDPWLSSSDIEAGARWGSDIAGKLETSKVGIICLTPSNLEAIWIHFEAGALAKTLDNTFVCPYLVGVKPSDVKGPLAQFQAMLADEQGTRRLVETLNHALADKARKPKDLAEAFTMWWPKLKEALDSIPKEESTGKGRSERDMLEEILELSRLQARHEARAAFQVTTHQLVSLIDSMKSSTKALRTTDESGNTIYRLINAEGKCILEFSPPSPSIASKLEEALHRGAGSSTTAGPEPAID